MTDMQGRYEFMVIADPNNCQVDETAHLHNPPAYRLHAVAVRVEKYLPLRLGLYSQPTAADWAAWLPGSGVNPAGAGGHAPLKMSDGGTVMHHAPPPKYGGDFVA